MRISVCLLVAASFFGPALSAQCVNFPASYIPLSSVRYVTAANPSGDHLVVGALAGGVSALNAQLPLPTSTNETFCDSQVQLAPQQFYPNVYVPTAQEISGNFAPFAGLLLDPVNNLPFAGGIIPANQVGSVYAIRIGAAEANQSVKGWSPTGSMTVPRFADMGVLLPNGKVLLIGGGTNDNTAELYNPATGSFQTAGNLLFSGGHSTRATLLNDGRVLIEGGDANSLGAELFDPASGKFTATGSLLQPHAYEQTATLLHDGRVLIVGGLANQGQAADTNAGAELYDPKTGMFTRAGAMSVNRRAHTATLLPDGRVLIAGGEVGVFNSPTQQRSLDSAEIYDPASGLFSPTSPMVFARSRFFAVLLSNGKVLLGGGAGTSAELFDPLTARFDFTGSMNQARGQDTGSALLSSGQVLIAGGNGPGPNGPLTSAELYSPATHSFSPTSGMSIGRVAFATVVLPDGRVLAAGGYTQACCIPVASAEIYTPVSEGLVTSQTGLTFRAAQGAKLVTPQTLAVLSPTDQIPWTVSIKTYSGGNWLTASPASATTTPGAAPVPLTVNVDATGLAPQDYYGAVTLTPTDGKHPPVSIAVVFSIVPAGTAAPLSVLPTGLVFLSTSGLSPKPQTFTITNVTSRAVNFAATASANSAFFDFSLKAGTITSVLPGVITVTPSSATLTAGVYRSSINLVFSDGSTQAVDLLLVVSAAPASSIPNLRGATVTACTPRKLLPVLTTIGTGTTAPVAWPVALNVQVQDDCGASVNAGSVTASFSNGDPPISLTAIGAGTWSATWVPSRISTGATVRADAQLQQPALSGTVQVSVQVASNPKVPVVASGGVLSSGDYASSPALGLLVSIFGSALADGSAGITGLPLPLTLGSTQVLLSGINLPVLYVSENQVNVLIPYTVAANTPHQLVIQRANAISVPVSTAVFDARPAILATAGNGAGQGHIYKATSPDGQILADKNSPASAGDVLVIYCVGLGAVTPAVNAGDPAPSSPLAAVAAPVTVTISGQTAQPFFAGLTPTFAGLYQVNVTMPAGVTAGSQVPVTISVGAKSSAGAIYMAVKGT